MVKKKIDVNYNASEENIVIHPKGINHPDSVKGIEELSNDELKLSIQAMENLDPVIWVRQSDITKLHEMIKTKDAELVKYYDLEKANKELSEHNHDLKCEVGSKWKAILKIKKELNTTKEELKLKDSQIKELANYKTAYEESFNLWKDLESKINKHDKELEVVKLERDIAFKSNGVSLNELSKLQESLAKTDRDYNNLLVKKDTEINKLQLALDRGDRHFKDSMDRSEKEKDSMQRNIDVQQVCIRVLEDNLAKVKEYSEVALKAYTDLIIKMVKG